MAREQVITDLRKEIEIQEYKHIETIKSVSEQVDEKLKLLSEFKGKVNQLQSSLQEREQLHEGDRYLMG